MEGEISTNEVYRECLRNHAASLGSYATDGCGEFTLDDTSPGGLECAACGCHRNFHRKVTYAGGNPSSTTATTTTTTTTNSLGRGAAMMSCNSRGRDHQQQQPSSMMMMNAVVESPESDRSEKKRFRTKFTVDQKEKMMGFAEKLGWKLQRKDLDDEIERFCKSVGISRQVFKVWMHNHKNLSSSSSASTGNASSLTQ